MQLVILSKPGALFASSPLMPAEADTQAKGESTSVRPGVSFAEVLSEDTAQLKGDSEEFLQVIPPESQPEGQTEANPEEVNTDTDDATAKGGEFADSAPETQPLAPPAPDRDGRPMPHTQDPALQVGALQPVAEHSDASLGTPRQERPIAATSQDRGLAPAPPTSVMSAAVVSASGNRASGPASPAPDEGLPPARLVFGREAFQPSKPVTFTQQSSNRFPALRHETAGPSPRPSPASPVPAALPGSSVPGDMTGRADAPSPRPSPQTGIAQAELGPVRASSIPVESSDPQTRLPVSQTNPAAPALLRASHATPQMVSRLASESPAVLPPQSASSPDIAAPIPAMRDTAPVGAPSSATRHTSSAATPLAQPAGPRARFGGSPVTPSRPMPQASFVTAALSGSASSPPVPSAPMDVSGEEVPPVSELRFSSEPAALHRPNPGTAPMTPGTPRHVAAQITEAIQRAGRSRVIDLTLSPAELGRVKISLQPSEGVMLVNIIADRSETLDLMRRHAELLAQDFHSIGFGEAKFSFSRQSSGQEHAAAASAPRDEGEANRTATAVEDLPRPPRPAGLILSDRVDIRL